MQVKNKHLCALNFCIMNNARTCPMQISYLCRSIHFHFLLNTKEYIQKSRSIKSCSHKLLQIDLNSCRHITLYLSFTLQFSGLGNLEPDKLTLGRRTTFTERMESTKKYSNYHLAVICCIFLPTWTVMEAPQLPNPHLSTLDCSHEIEGLKYRGVLCYSLWKH